MATYFHNFKNHFWFTYWSVVPTSICQCVDHAFDMHTDIVCSVER